MEQNVVKEKSYNFAKRIVRLAALLNERHHFAIANQVIRSGTSVGANIEEATGSVSTKEFLAKHAVAFKEAKETHYWLRLIIDTDLIEPNLGRSLLTDCDELCRLLNAITKTLREKVDRPQSLSSDS